MNTIALVTDREDIKLKLQESLVLLRGTDRLISVSYENSKEILDEFSPYVIIIHQDSNTDSCSELIKYIKSKKNIDNSIIILMLDSIDGEFLLKCYDEGADDYMRTESEPAEILIRVINAIRQAQLKNKFSLYACNLEYYGILDNKSKYYTAKTAEDMINFALIRNNYSCGTYMLINVDDEAKKIYSYEKMLSVLKTSLRLNDIVIGFSASKFGILSKSGVTGAISLFERLKTALPEDWQIKAGIVSIGENKYSELEKNAICALNEAGLSEVGYSVYTGGKNDEDWLSSSEDSEHIYKFYKKAFNSKIENIISPIFYRVQKTYEDRIGDAKIEQFTDEKQSVFRIILDKRESRLTMSYPGYSKLVIYISHTGLDTPENREITVPLREITQAKIAEIVESFVNEYIGIYRHC